MLLYCCSYLMFYSLLLSHVFLLSSSFRIHTYYFLSLLTTYYYCLLPTPPSYSVRHGAGLGLGVCYLTPCAWLPVQQMSVTLTPYRPGSWPDCLTPVAPPLIQTYAYLYYQANQDYATQRIPVLCTYHLLSYLYAAYISHRQRSALLSLTYASLCGGEGGSVGCLLRHSVRTKRPIR